MDRQKLVSLLQESQLPDTQRLKAVTAELQKKYYAHPESLVLLFELVCTSSGDDALRQQAAIQAARLTHKHWKAIPAEQKAAIRKHIVENTMKEGNTKVGHASARLVASLGALDHEESAWPELVPALFNLASSNDRGQREVASYIIFSTLEANALIYTSYVPKLLELYGKTIVDPESVDVRINTMLSIGATLVLIDSDEDEEAVSAVQNLVPHMGVVLKGAVDAGDDEKVTQGFEVLQQFLAYESVFLGGHLRTLLEFMLIIAADAENTDDDVRIQALAFLTQAVQYRRMKIQAMPDIAKSMVSKSLQILTELDDDEDPDETSPPRMALALLDELAEDLPPRQVMVPLLDEFRRYSASTEASHRKAGIRALGTCAEGAPDFVVTQIQAIRPILIRLLNDPDGDVRHSALIGLTGLAEEMAEELAQEHEAIITALAKNLQAAMVAAADEKTAKKNVSVIRSACAALDAMSEGIKPEIMGTYAPQLIEPVGNLLAHNDFKVRSGAAGALGAIAGSLGEGFKPYFADSMRALGSYMDIKETEEDLELRSSVSDALGRIAVAVGAETFQPYVVELMKASEVSLNLENARLRESSFILWSALAKVYEKDFEPFLPGVFKGLFDALELEEEEVILELTEEEKAIVGGSEELITAGKRVKLRDAGADEGLMADDDDDDDDEEWEDFIGSSLSMEKEVALEVLGDVISFSCGKAEVTQHLEKALTTAINLLDHPYEGIRKAAVGTLWRAYARVWQLMEEETGTKWEPGFPPKQAPNALLLKIGEMISQPTVSLWAEEGDRAVVADLNRNVSATLKACGPAILVQEKVLDQTISALSLIITRSHPCQQDLGDDDEEHDVGETAEYDWLVIDTALDVIIGLAMALGPAFGEIWKVFEKPVMKFASSNESIERSTAVGVIADCVGYMGSSVTPYTSSLLRLLLHRLSDEDPETKSNTAYGVGQLILNSEDSKSYLPSYPTILAKLVPLLQSPDGHRLFDNAAGCVCRMITAHPDRVAIEEYLSGIVERLPLTEDYEEHKPIFTCLYKLYEHNEPTVQQMTPQLISVFEKVLGPPEEQLDDETRQLIQQAVRILYKAHPDLFHAHPDVLRLSGVA